MKTKVQILELIKKTREIRDSYRYLGSVSKPFRDICNGQIRALQTVLDYKVGEWYWCIDCQNQHKGLRCPRCGNEKLKLPAEVS